MNALRLTFDRLWASIRGLAEPRRLARLAVIGAIVWAFVVLVTPRIPTPHTISRHWELPAPVIVLGLIVGMTYGLLAVGLVLIYRSNRIVNFAHGQIGAFAAAFFGLMVTRWGVPYWIAFIPAIVVAAGVGAGTEAMVVRRLRKAPAIMSVVATLGVGQFLVLLSFAINAGAGGGLAFPSPAGMPTMMFGALLITQSYFAMLVLAPVVVIAVGLFLKLTWFGVGIRSAAANTEAARMAGVPANKMSSVAWGLSGAVSGFGAILMLPTQGLASGATFGPQLLLIALTGAVLARMQSLPIALMAGAAIGILEQLILWNYTQAGLVQPVLFVIIVGSMLLQRQQVGRGEQRGSWATVQALRPLPAAIRRVPAVRVIRPLILIGFVAVFAWLPSVLSNATAVKLTGSMALVIVGLSVVIVTGLGGQLSLGQFALGAVGAVVSFEVARRTGSYVEAFVYAGLVAAIVSVVIGIPALRIKGLLLTVTTLSFGISLSTYLLKQEWMLGTGRDVGRPIVFGTPLTSGRSYYYVGLVTLLLTLWLAHNVRRGGIGRRLVAVRDNEDAARAFTVPASWVKLQGFALAGFIAGVGGAMYGHAIQIVSPASFPIDASINAVVIAVIGGLGLLSGPFLGAALVQGATFLPLDAAGLAATSLGQLLIIMYLPGGIGSLVPPIRERITTWLARRAGVDVEAAYTEERGFDGEGTEPGPAPVLHRDVARHRADVPFLEAQGLVKSFGGVHAVRGVSFRVWRGETVGLIGPNGAGKTTTFELLGGFTKADQGTVHFRGRDVTRLSPEARGRMGLIRSFQDAALFPTLTVLECVDLALERAEPVHFGASLLGFQGRERRRMQRAEELVSWMGLERYRSSQIQELSTGTRRITEIACLVALQPDLLLLDEPSSGVAQRETEALAKLLVRLKDELGLTLLIIEHDIPMIMSMSDRIICMADGEIISQGSPDHVRNDLAVVEAYLGGSITAIERSSTGGSTEPAEVKA